MSINGLFATIIMKLVYLYPYDTLVIDFSLDSHCNDFYPSWDCLFISFDICFSTSFTLLRKKNLWHFALGHGTKNNPTRNLAQSRNTTYLCIQSRIFTRHTRMHCTHSRYPFHRKKSSLPFPFGDAYYGTGDAYPSIDKTKPYPSSMSRVFHGDKGQFVSPEGTRSVTETSHTQKRTISHC